MWMQWVLGSAACMFADEAAASCGQVGDNFLNFSGLWFSFLYKYEFEQAYFKIYTDLYHLERSILYYCAVFLNKLRSSQK